MNSETTPAQQSRYTYELTDTGISTTELESTYELNSTYELKRMQQHTQACTASKHTQSQHGDEKEEETQSSTLNQEATCSLLLAKGKVSFLQQSVTWYINHTLRQVTCQEVVG